MKAFVLKWQWQIVCAAILAGELIAAVAGGWRGSAGLAMGIAATWFGSWALWAVLGVVGDAVRQAPVVRTGTTVIVMAFLLKLPVLIGMGFLSHKLGGAAFTCFLAGLGMVYFAVVGWAVART